MAEEQAREAPAGQGSNAIQPKKPVEKQAPLGMADMPVGGEARTELSLLPNCKNFAEVFQLCNWIAESNIVPEAYRGRPADIFVAAEYGSDIGLKFMTAIQNIAIISGRPALPSDIKLAMVRGKNLLEWKKEASIEEIKKTGIAWCEMKRIGVDQVERHTYTIDDAKMARVWEKLGRNDYPTPWVTHKFRMLQLKPRDMCLRDLFGDVFKGLLSVEEAQEIEIIQDTHSDQVLIEQKSQPETKGKEILQAEAPSLKPSPTFVKPEEGTGALEAVGAGGGPVQLPEQSKEPKEEAEKKPEAKGPLATLVDTRLSKLRGMAAGSAAALKVWTAFKLPVAQFGKQEPSDLLPAEQLQPFNDMLEKALVGIEDAKSRK
jgi:hypothetical protein